MPRFPWHLRKKQVYREGPRNRRDWLCDDCGKNKRNIRNYPNAPAIYDQMVILSMRQEVRLCVACYNRRQLAWKAETVREECARFAEETKRRGQ
jgi:hypothetical protein